MRMYDLIIKKRDGLELSKEEINYFVKNLTEGNIADYHVAAFLMAVFLKKMNKRETADLTQAMMHSGDVVDLSQISGIKVDKHSTGGVGDTTTLVLAPLVASCGVPVAKMSGRGLGHTGGTIDKLEAIEGFHVEISIDDFINNVNKHGIAVIGQTKNIAPADKKIYALRDVTATVDNISLIASSIMSKKLAAGSDAIVLDVKVGSGAFMKTIEDAIELGKEMVEIGQIMDKNTIAIITDMEQPLGFAIGNALEVKEAIDTLNNEGPEDLTELCVKLGSNMVYLGGGADSVEAAEKLIREKLANGEAFEKFKEFISIQGGNVDVINDPSKLPSADHVREIKSDVEGYLETIKSDSVGIAAMKLGAGRETLDSVLDMSAGIILNKKVGDKINKGDVIATLYTNTQSKLDESEKMFLDAITITKDEVASRKLIKAIVNRDGVQKF
ncbi:MAG: pyrimidine-nucleoside phosphorylase [Firmicutes bacterium]|nr:pyrimidine-nucleoside phosphorylase [Bacillota bacterium]